MATISLQDVQNQLPHFVAEAEAGHEIIIERGGKPVARLVALAEAPQPRRRLVDRPIKTITNNTFGLSLSKANIGRQ